MALRTARNWAADLDGNLLADNAGHTSCDRVGLTNLTALSHLDGFGVALPTTRGFADGTCATFRHHFADAIGACFGLALRDHFTGGVIADLGSVFTHHAADLVADFFGLAFRDHFAGGVIANLGSVFAYHSADLVAHLFGAALGYHPADGVVASFGFALGNHAADPIGAGLGATFGNDPANGVWNLAGSAFAPVPRAGNFLLFAGRNPGLLANGFGRALDALGTAFAWCVNTLASARIEGPCSRFANGFSHHGSGDRFGFGFPVPALDGNRFGVRFWHDDTVLFRSCLLLSNRVVNGVVHFAGFGFVNRLADGVVDGACFCLVDRFADGVLDGLFSSLVDGFLDRVVDGPLMGLINRLANGVLDRFLACFVDGPADGVIDRSLVRLIDRFADGVIDGPGTCFVFGNHHGVVDVPSRCLGDHAAALNLLVFVIHLIPLAVPCFFDLVVDRLTDSSHAGIRSASHRGGCRFVPVRSSPASTTALVADGTTVRSARGIRRNHDHTDHYGGHDPQPIHLDFSTGNNTSVARRSFGDHGASALTSRHRSPCLFLGDWQSGLNPV